MTEHSQTEPIRWFDNEPEVAQWISEGRTEEQAWAVRNFLTGAGKKMIERLLQANDDKWVEKIRTMLRQ